MQLSLPNMLRECCPACKARWEAKLKRRRQRREQIAKLDELIDQQGVGWIIRMWRLSSTAVQADYGLQSTNLPLQYS